MRLLVPRKGVSEYRHHTVDRNVPHSLSSHAHPRHSPLTPLLASTMIICTASRLLLVLAASASGASAFVNKGQCSRPSSNVLLASSSSSSASDATETTTRTSAESNLDDFVRSFAVYEDGKCVGTCQEVRPKARDPMAEEDEVEMFYQTTQRSFTFPQGWTDEVDDMTVASQRSFLFPRSTSSDNDGGHAGWDAATEAERLLRADSIPLRKVNIRQTSFGCGRLGATVWPSGIALAALLSGDYRHLVQGKRVLELGSGCGLPSLVAKDVAGASDVMATDYWEEDDGKFDADRLVPKNLFGANLAHNIGSETAAKHLDWHDQFNVMNVYDEFEPEVIIGSDLVYYLADTPPLIQTLNILLKSGAKDALLVLPLPPNAEREALPEFRSRLLDGALEDCSVQMKELTMVGSGSDDRHNLLRIHISKE